MSEPDLTTRLNQAYADRLSAADFDLVEPLEAVLQGVGLTLSDSGGLAGPRAGGGAATARLSGKVGGDRRSASLAWRGGSGYRH